MLLDIKGLTFAYATTPILKGISLRLESGKFYAIIGSNGCGKSTLFNVILRTLKPQSGSVSLDDVRLEDLSFKDQAKRISVLSQSMSLPEFMSVQDLVMQGRFAHQGFLSRYSDEDVAIVHEAMQTMGVHDFKDRSLSALSGGQLQRCRMAMLLAQRTPVVLLDEPTTYLDLKHQYDLLDMGKALCQEGKLVVAILHDIAQASLYADEIIVLHDGVVHAQGCPKQVVNSKLMHEVFGVETCCVDDKYPYIHIPKHLL